MDKIVVEARKLLGDAVATLTQNDRYNKNVAYYDTMPNGIEDHIRMLMEPIFRIDATNDRDKAVDYLGYSSLYLGWVREGCPKSKYNYIAYRYKQLFRIQERRIELNQEEKKVDLREMRRDENDTDGNGCGSLPQLSG